MNRNTAIGSGTAIVAGAMLLNTESGQSPAPSGGSYVISLDATPREVNEGDLVEFWANVKAGDGADPFAFPEYIWEFGDGSPPLKGVDLTLVHHRFADGKDRLHPVRLRVDDTEREIFVSVMNVPPTVHTIGRDGPALRGSPVEFEAMATDPAFWTL